MLDWWMENGPPVYIAAAAYLGIQKTGSSKDKAPGDLNELLKMAGPGGMIQ